jgi:3'-phosphoadenosine 5'-phosphosulfate sulfotransferase (PAPS reductase)/FAD synthetase
MVKPFLFSGRARAESSTRAANMKEHAKRAVRERLSPNASLANSLIYTPIETWSNDDVLDIPYASEEPLGLQQPRSHDDVPRAQVLTASALSS